MPSLYKQNSNAFTLIELSIIIIIISLMTIAVAQRNRELQPIIRDSSTLDKLQLIESTLEKYRRTHHRYPCPADPEFAVDQIQSGTELRDPDYGDGSANHCLSNVPLSLHAEMIPSVTGNITQPFGHRVGVYIGLVPYKELGLSVNDVYDQWGNGIMYMISAQRVIDGYDLSGGDVVILSDYNPADDLTTNLTNYDIDDRAIYALISYGKDGIGGYLRSGARIAPKELAFGEYLDSYYQMHNHHHPVYGLVADNVLIAPNRALGTPTDPYQFDDIIKYKSMKCTGYEELEGLDLHQALHFDGLYIDNDLNNMIADGDISTAEIDGFTGSVEWKARPSYSYSPYYDSLNPALPDVAKDKDINYPGYWYQADNLLTVLEVTNNSATPDQETINEVFGADAQYAIKTSNIENFKPSVDFSFNGVLDSSSSIAGLSPSYVGNLHEVGSCLTVDGNFRPKDAFVVAKCNNGDIDCHGSLLSLSDINNISGNMTIGQHEEFFSFGYNPRYIASPPSSSPEINFCSADNIPVVGNHTDLCSVNGSVGDIIADTDYTNWNVLYGSKTNIVDPSINDILIGCSSGDLPSNSYYDDALLSRPYHSYFQGQIAEVIMFNKDVNGIDINLTTNQKEFLFCYLRDKWRSVKK